MCASSSTSPWPGCYSRKAPLRRLWRSWIDFKTRPKTAGGFRPVEPHAIGLLVIAYVATAVFEEGFWRGLVLGVLRPTGLWRAVLISSLLFGLGTWAIQLCAGSRQSLPQKPLARVCGCRFRGASLAHQYHLAVHCDSCSARPVLADGYAAHPLDRSADRHHSACLRRLPLAPR
jgi:hypothetical protein